MAAVVASCLGWTRLLVLFVVLAVLCDWTVAEPGLIHTAPDMSSVSSGGVGQDKTNVITGESQATIETVEPYVIKLPTFVSVLLPVTPVVRRQWSRAPQNMTGVSKQGLETESSRAYVETKERQSYKGKVPKLLNVFPNTTTSPAERKPISTTTTSAERKPVRINIVSSKAGTTPADIVGLGDNLDPRLNTNKKEFLSDPMSGQLLSLVKREVADNFTDLDGVPTNETDDMLDTTPFGPTAQNLTTKRWEPTRTTAAPSKKVPEKRESTNSGFRVRGHKLKTLCWLSWIVVVFPWRAEV